jgi:hypothetical protein
LSPCPQLTSNWLTGAVEAGRIVSRPREETSISADVARTITPEVPKVKVFCGYTAGYSIERSTSGGPAKQLQIDEPIFPAFSL